MPKYVQSLAVIDDKDYDYNDNAKKKGNRDDEYESDYTGDYTDDYYYDDKKWIKIETKEHYILTMIKESFQCCTPRLKTPQPVLPWYLHKMTVHIVKKGYYQELNSLHSGVITKVRSF